MTNFRQAVQLDPVGAAVVHNNIGLVLEKQGRMLDAIAEYKKALSANPNDKLAMDNLNEVKSNLCASKNNT